MSNSPARERDTRAVQMRDAAISALNPNAPLAKFLPTGASAATAQPEGLSAGICASYRLAQMDLPRLRRFQSWFEAAGVKYGLPPALLAAIASRESRAGGALDVNGLGGGGDCFGLMQLDSRYHPPRGGPYSSEHIDQAARVLERLWEEVKAKHPGWPPEQQLRGAVVAYDAGVSYVRTIKDMDRGTTGDDYSNDVWARAQALAPSFGGPVSPGVATGPTSSTFLSLRDRLAVPGGKGVS
jgi:soluble lytic murein transglycosylase-like protein